MPDISWSDLVAALGLVLVIEGAAFTLFTARMKSMMSLFLEVEDRQIRIIALFTLIIGFIIVWLARG